MAAIEGVRDVADSPLPPAGSGLLVTAAANFDWAGPFAELHRQSYWAVALRADDLVGNLRALAAHERAIAGEEREARQRATAVLGTLDGRLLGERLLLQELARLGACRDAVSDPRLMELIDLAQAANDLWRAAAPALDGNVLPVRALDGKAVPVPVVGPTIPPTAVGNGLAPPGGDRVALRVAAAIAAPFDPADGPAFDAARARVGDRWRQSLAMRLCWHRVVVVGNAVADHCERTALRTKTPAMRDRYLALAARCRDLAEAGQRLLAP